MDGFAPHTSGLYVPVAVALTREVWTRDEWRAYEKALTLMRSRGLAVKLRCQKPDCPDPKLTIERVDGTESHLKCGCTDRVFTTRI
jgi:hypothetical protein